MSAPTVATKHAPWCRNHILDTDGVYGWCEATFTSARAGEVVVTNGTLDDRTKICAYLDDPHSLDSGLTVDAALNLAILLVQAAAATRSEAEQVQQ